MSTALVIEKSKNNPDNMFLKGTLLVTSTLTVMAGATISPALPALSVVFDEVPNADLLVRLVLTLPALFIAIGAPIAGMIVDKYGRKPLLIASVILYGFAGGSGYLVNNIWALLFGRSLLGIAVAGIMTTVTTLIADYYQGKERSAFLGVQASFSGIGGVIFLSLGGFLADSGWHTPFLIYLFSFLILPFIIFSLYEPTTMPMQNFRSESNPFDNVALPIGLLIFVYITMTVVQIVFYSVPVQLPYYLGNLVGANGAQSGLAIACLSLFFSVASASFGWFDQRLPNLYTMLVGFALTGSGFIALTFASGWILIGVGLMISGFGLGLVVPNMITWVAGSVSESIRGRALGGVTTALFLGQFLSPFVITPLTKQTGEGGVYAVLGVMLLIAALVELVLRNAIHSLTRSEFKE